MKYTKDSPPLQCIMSQSTCYKGTQPMQVRGVLWHSTGANNPTIKRYVQPDDNAGNKYELLNIIGVNKYHNDWNHITRKAGVNAWIGKLNDGNVSTVQALPWHYRPWGCGSGKKGSCNDGWIQFEVCEDNLKDQKYFEQIYNEGIELTAYLCRLYNINPTGTVKLNEVVVPTILSHAESYKLGLGSNHGDIDYWFKKYGKTMADVRKDVEKLLKATTTPAPTPAPAPSTAFKIGDLVSILSNAVYASGKTIPSWVMKKNWYIAKVYINGTVVIDRSEDNTSAICSRIEAKYLKKVTKTSNDTFKAYQVQVNTNALNRRSGPSTDYPVLGVIRTRGVYTIIDEAKDKNGAVWGKLGANEGWIMLKYTRKIS